MCAQARLRRRSSFGSGRIAAVSKAPIPLEDARAQVLAAAGELARARLAEDGAIETAAIEQALGRTLAQELRAPHPLPPFDASAMDGYALRAADVAEAGPQSPVALSLCGEARAGHPFSGTLQSGQAVVISTGAMLPVGADAVARLEEARREGRHVLIDRPLRAGSVVRAAGRRLSPVELALAAALGYARVPVARPPRVALLATGDELLTPAAEASGATLGAGQIFESNTYGLAALAQLAGASVVGRSHARDEREQLAEALERT